MSNPYLTEAYASLPHVAEAEERAKKATEIKRRFRGGLGADAARNEVIKAAIDAFRTSGEWPEDIGTQAADAYAEGLARESERLAVFELERITAGNAEAARDDARYDVLGLLRERQEALLEGARKHVEALKGVTTAEGAIEAGGAALKAFKDVTDAARDYSTLRAAVLQTLKSMGDDAEAGNVVNVWRLHVEFERPSDVPEFVAENARTGRYDVASFAWVVTSGTPHVPADVADVRESATAVEVYDEPPHIYASYEVPIQPPRPAKVYDYARPLDIGDGPGTIKPNATMADPRPSSPIF
ncbi:predicted protein [Streptomyces sp. SPB78]|uniref:hypothetical protein n=1 Tax=Streptomyces sp. (strain SPB78) TaxID=591157 RepID=UPI0001B553AE|nr:hypothetical protein [Streptomyces sp. SPB78]EFK99540.1 predicted protein [Streptomyces sp. SPB78]